MGDRFVLADRNDEVLSDPQQQFVDFLELPLLPEDQDLDFLEGSRTFGSVEPRAVMETWPIDREYAATRIKSYGAPITADRVSGEARLLRLCDVDGRPCMDLEGEVRLKGPNSPLPEGFKATAGEERTRVLWIIPLDTTLPACEETWDACYEVKGKRGQGSSHCELEQLLRIHMVLKTRILPSGASPRLAGTARPASRSGGRARAAIGPRPLPGGPAPGRLLIRSDRSHLAPRGTPAAGAAPLSGRAASHGSSVIPSYN